MDASVIKMYNTALVKAHQDYRYADAIAFERMIRESGHGQAVSDYHLSAYLDSQRHGPTDIGIKVGSYFKDATKELVMNAIRGMKIPYEVFPDKTYEYQGSLKPIGQKTGTVGDVARATRGPNIWQPNQHDRSRITVSFVCKKREVGEPEDRVETDQPRTIAGLVPPELYRGTDLDADQEADKQAAAPLYVLPATWNECRPITIRWNKWEGRAATSDVEALDQLENEPPQAFGILKPLQIKRDQDRRAEEERTRAVEHRQMMEYVKAQSRAQSVARAKRNGPDDESSSDESEAGYRLRGRRVRAKSSHNEGSGMQSEPMDLEDDDRKPSANASSDASRSA